MTRKGAPPIAALNSPATRRAKPRDRRYIILVALRHYVAKLDALLEAGKLDYPDAAVQVEADRAAAADLLRNIAHDDAQLIVVSRLLLDRVVNCRERSAADALADLTRLVSLVGCELNAS